MHVCTVFEEVLEVHLLLTKPIYITKLTKPIYIYTYIHTYITCL